MDVFVGTIMTFGFTYAPAQWALCNGQTFTVNQYQALYALITNIYGGTPGQTFKVPDLQGRMQIGMGQGASLTNRAIGAASGAESVTVAIANMPSHVHTLSSLTATTTINLANPAVTGATIAPTPDNAYIGASTSGPTSANIFSPGVGTTPVVQKGVTTAVSGTMQPAGNGLPLNNMNPFLALNFSIALQGLYPMRD